MESVWRIARSVPGVASTDSRLSVEREVSALFAELRAPLLRYMHSLGLSVSDGEDVVQEVFLQLFRHLAAGKPRDNLRGWVFRVGHNLARKHRQRQLRQAPGGVVELEMTDEASNPEEQIRNLALQRRLMSVVQALSERDRQCLVLRAEGLRYREIAEALGMSLGAVASSLSRSLGKLAITGERYE
ncbi:MAG: sigma-70 family RNA polymerase sigma factor [Bryobacteraceae bacterium]|nr:sigma-70 family RNA polymerase sigma factor [Bryobacteraceae bacterium]MDW8377622.1 sigma-70 family RNA polymerase sigma factor [Bryobacterales bacterium]